MLAGRSRAVFMNPGEGHEKGNVENKFGYQRRNFMVPVPRFISLRNYNKKCAKKMRIGSITGMKKL